jgi:NADH-quinone oxidoreductase subunit A
MAPFESARHRFSVKFYLVAMLFILFDVEAAFLYPWALTLRNGGKAAFVFGEMGVFMGVLVLGYIYVWRRGALEWD